MEHYVCRIPTQAEMAVRWDRNIASAKGDKGNWIIWKEETIGQFRDGLIIPYYGFLDGRAICECTAAVSPLAVGDPEGLVDGKTVYLSAFRTDREHRGKGYFSALFRYMISDLKARGYERASLGVEPQEMINRQIYEHLGFTEHIKDSQDTYPDGTVISVQYYAKDLKA